MNRFDEPAMSGTERSELRDTEAPLSVQMRIRNLLRSQPFAVLCTQGSGQPYGSVVAYAFSQDLKQAVFATARATRKYRLLSECDHVALVVDSRPTYPDDLMQVEAITATGRASEVAAPESELWSDLLMSRHPQLKPFILSPTTALFSITIVRYLHVSRFQEVHQWVPDDTTSAESSS